MATGELTVRLVGQHERAVSLDDFIEFCKSVFTITKRVEEALTGHTNHVRFEVADLNKGSARLRLIARPTKHGTAAECREVTDVFRKTVSAISRGARVDKRLAEDDIRAFADLASPLDKKSKEVWIGRTKVTQSFRQKVEQLAKPQPSSSGEVTGFIEKLDVHNKNQFDLFPAFGGAVRCRFPDSMFPAVRKAVKRHAMVSGIMHYRPHQVLPHRVDVEGIKLLPDDSTLPTLGSLRGMAPNCTDGLGSVNFVRSIRDEQD